METLLKAEAGAEDLDVDKKTPVAVPISADINLARQTKVLFAWHPNQMSF